MAEESGRSSRRQLVSLVIQVLDTTEKQQAFVNASLFSIPKLHAQIRVGQSPQAFAHSLVVSCLVYGQERGRSAIGLLLDELENLLGDEYRRQIADIRADLLPPKSPAPVTRPTDNIKRTDALIKQFYALYKQQQWRAALEILARLEQASNLPNSFDIRAYRDELQRSLRQHELIQDRNRDYDLFKLMQQVGEPRERVWANLKMLWGEHPGYDPDNLVSWVFENDPRYQEATRRIARAYHYRSERLMLNDLGLEVIPSEIVHLKELRWLYCANNRLLTLPDALCELSTLEGIHAEHNHLKHFPTSIVLLPQLRSLYLRGNRITQLPPEISQLQHIEILDLRENHLRKLPLEITQLHRLSVLVLDNNALTDLPMYLFSLHNLTWLMAANNQLVSVSPGIEALRELRSLSLSYNRLRNLPPGIGRLPKLETLLVVRGNPLDQLPPNVVQGGNQRVLRWLRTQH